MTLIFNRNTDKNKRLRLRQNMTEAEKHLWAQVRYRKIDGYIFRRQFSVAGFILDFYCPELRLAIEVDGSIHNSEQQICLDKERERIVKSLGIAFLRFSNDQVIIHPGDVINAIQIKINGLKQSGSPLPRGSR